MRILYCVRVLYSYSTCTRTVIGYGGGIRALRFGHEVGDHRLHEEEAEQHGDGEVELLL